jgi:hypothetical protein
MDKILIVFCAAVLVPSAGALAFDRDMEEAGMFSLPKPGVEELKRERREAAAPHHVDKEVKFVAGKDGKWFTGDDAVYHYYLAEYDNGARLVKRSCMKPGKDGLPSTGDDELQDFRFFEHDDAGRLVNEHSFDARGKEQSNTVFFYDAEGAKAKDVRYAADGRVLHYVAFEPDSRGLIVRDREYKGPGPDKKWFTADDELEKYHRRYYDPDGRLLRAEECHAEHGGSGPDGKWFTADDTVFATRQFLREGGTRVNKTLKCIGAGPDGKWFTGDDVLQYYTLRYFAEGDAPHEDPDD